MRQAQATGARFEHDPQGPNPQGSVRGLRLLAPDCLDQEGVANKIGGPNFPDNLNDTAVCEYCKPYRPEGGHIIWNKYAEALRNMEKNLGMPVGS